MSDKYFAMTLILSVKPNAKDQRLLNLLKVDKRYKAFYEIDKEDQGWFIPPQKDFEGILWLTKKDGKNRSDFRNEAYIMDNFFVVRGGNYDIGEDGTMGFNLL